MRYVSLFAFSALGLLGCGDDSSGEGGSGGGSTTTASTTSSTSSSAMSSTSATTSSTTAATTGATTSSTGSSMCVMFGADCTMSDTCCDAAGETGICYAFGMGSKCTIPCPADPGDCPNNGAGCNNMDPSYCKAN